MAAVPRMAGARRAAVLGSPISHSLSPALYRAGFAAAGLAGWSFEAVECDAADLPDLIRGLGADWAGLAVTMPGKTVAAAAADERSARVETLGVANTLIRLSDGRWRAENTDVDGVVGALGGGGRSGTSGRSGTVLPGSAPSGPAGDPDRASALVLGGGGTALATLAALVEMEWAGPVLVSGRRPESTVRARQVGARLGLDVAHLDLVVDRLRAVAAEVGLVVSTLPAGIADPFADALATVPVLLDVIYRPWPTALAAAGGPGRVTATGLDMLLHQAWAQFPLITGVPAPREAMRRAVAA
jgi:shikimate dehydrogenase